MARGFVSLPVSSGGGDDWVRPSDWLAMPTVTSAEQKFVGLHAIHPNGNNFAAFLFTTSAGQYQVDWGDGTTDLVNSNVKAEHEYDYATYDVADATLSSRGYKQAIITVTPVSGNLLTCNFQQRYTGQNQAYATGFLDCIISMPNHSASAFTFGGNTVRHAYVERFDVKTLGSCNSLTNMFYNCFSLQSIPLFNTASVTSMTNMFLSCFSLQSIPLFNTASVTSMTSMFYFCYSLQSVPLFNTASVTSMTNMFYNCYSLQSVPLFNTASVTSMSSMFLSCFSLQSIPLFNTASVTNMASMFRDCLSLRSVPLFNTASVTNMGGMFQACNSIKALPALSTSSITTAAGTDFGASFAINCNSLDRCEMVFARTVGFANCQLSKTALEEIFTNLVDRSATTSATITITGNYGAATADTTIATTKNWTVTN